MPAIKKKWIKASQDGGNTPDDDNEDVHADEDRDHGAGEPVAVVAPKSKKRPHQSSPQASLLRGLDGEVLSEKRKRFIPPAELKLSGWLENNLEKRTEETLYLPHLYRYYTELCQGDGSEILDIPTFNRMVKTKFGKSFGIKETSVYKSLIKERKITQEKKKTGAGIKLKEIVHEAINHFGNPWSGVRFFSLKQFIGTKYPAIQIDQRPKLLKRALEMGTQYGQIDLVKGIGMAGYYKLPGGEPPSKAKPKSKKEDGDEKNTEDAGEAKDSGEDKEEKPEDSTENGEKKEETEDIKKKKKHKLKKIEKISFSKLHHGNPEKLEDIFPLAITYQSAPKSAAVPRIRRYIQEKYAETVQDNRWRKAIDSGAEKGYWEHVSGSGITGSLHLLMDDFDPESEQIEDRICAAIIACHEPKSASANQIKKYVSRYHSEFKVDEKPDKFKKALLRAVSKNMIVQLSGIGANGSFQLASIFTPTPAVLAGGDDSSEEEGYGSDEPTYVPRGTKSRGVPKVRKVEVTASSNKNAKVKAQRKPSSPVSKGRARPAANSYAETSEEEEEEEEAPKRKNKKPLPKVKPNTGRTASQRRARSPLPSDDEDDIDPPEYTPRKSESRGGVHQSETKAKPANKKKAAALSKVKTPKSAKKADSIDEDSSTDQDTPKKPLLKAESSDEEEIPIPTSKAKSSSSSKKVASVEKEEPSPAAKKSKKQPTAKENTKPTGKSQASLAPSKGSTKAPKEAASAKKKAAGESDDEVQDEVVPEYTPRKSKSRGGDSAKPAESEKRKGKSSRSRI